MQLHHNFSLGIVCALPTMIWDHPSLNGEPRRRQHREYRLRRPAAEEKMAHCTSKKFCLVISSISKCKTGTIVTLIICLL
mmetsp:Transcript_168/g.194  ORF Transcript_168/g.194 Transcript_168/m.194 type:complete len:80 (-) Transcript_168:16-255(-)